MLFICTASPTPHESFSSAGSYSPTRLAGSIRGFASGFFRPAERLAAFASEDEAACLEDCRKAMTALLMFPGEGRRIPPILAVCRVRSIAYELPSFLQPGTLLEVRVQVHINERRHNADLCLGTTRCISIRNRKKCTGRLVRSSATGGIQITACQPDRARNDPSPCCLACV